MGPREGRTLLLSEQFSINNDQLRGERGGGNDLYFSLVTINTVDRKAGRQADNPLGTCVYWDYYATHSVSAKWKKSKGYKIKAACTHEQIPNAKRGSQRSDMPDFTSLQNPRTNISCISKTSQICLVFAMTKTNLQQLKTTWTKSSVTSGSAVCWHQLKPGRW